MAHPEKGVNTVEAALEPTLLRGVPRTEFGTHPSVHMPGSTSMGESPVAVKAGDGSLPLVACSDGVAGRFIQRFQDS